MVARADSGDGPLGAKQYAAGAARSHSVINEELHDDVFGRLVFAEGQVLALHLPSLPILSDALVG